MGHARVALRMMCFGFAFGLLTILTLNAGLWAQDAPADAKPAETAEEQRERVTAERFLVLLKKTPRTGTALDKVYGYHVGRGSLDQFSASLKEEATSKNDGSTWMVLGMIQMLRGHDAEAALSLEQAEKLMPESSLPSYYLGKTLVLIGELEKATQAMERAIEKKPARTDLLEIFQNLGRLYQRTGKTEQALSIWKRLEDLFPGDDQVREEIAQILMDEGALEASLTKFDTLATSHKDRVRRIEMAVRAAEIRGKLGKTQEALKAFEGLLAQVNPGSWMHRDIRRRIEEVFYSSNDVEGLIGYYTEWTKAHPEDVDAMMRVGRFLSIQKRTPEAQEWFRKAIAKAPTDAEARLALVEALVRDNLVPEAAKEMAGLVEIQPGNPDYIIRWGELTYDDQKIAKPERQKAAHEIFMKLLVDHEKDAVTVSRVADLLRGIDLVDASIEQYRKAIELAPGEPQYREYLGEFLHKQDRKEEALALWKSLAEGDRKTRDNLVRLSEVYTTFDYDDLALSALTEACTMNPAFSHRARLAELLLDSKKYDESLAEIEKARGLAEDSTSRELIMDLLIKNYQNSGKLEQKIDEQEKLVETTAKDDAVAWRMMAMLYQTARQMQKATDAIENACKLGADDAMNWTFAAKLHDQIGRYGDAIADYRELAKIDRRYFSDYLTQIATLEMRVGRVEAALKTGEELIGSAPGNTQHYQLFASLCFQAGLQEKGLEILRRSVRSNPNDRDAVIYLSKTLADEFNTDEAIEFYWRAFDLSKSVEDQLQVIPQLAELYMRTNRFETLITRLETIGREANKPRDTVLLSAEAHQSTGDLGMARQLLEQLVRADSKDTKLLEQLVKLSRSEYDMESAIDYQRRLVTAAPTPQGEYLLATMLIEAGEVDQAQALWMRLSSRSGKTEDLVKMCGSLVQKGEAKTAAQLVERALELDPENWEVKALALNVLMRSEQKKRALEVAAQIKKMNLKPATLSVKTAEMLEKAKRSKSPASNQDYYTYLAENAGRHMMLIEASPQMKASMLGSNEDRSYYSSGQSVLFEPTSYRQAVAMADMVELHALEDNDKTKERIDKITEKAQESKDSDSLWKALLYQVGENTQILYNELPQQKVVVACLDELVKQNDSDAAMLRLSVLMNGRRLSSRNANSENVTPLEPELLSEIIKLADLVSTSQPKGPYAQNYSMMISAELRRAGRNEEADKYLKQYIDASSSNSIALFQAAQNLLSFNDKEDEAVKYDLTKRAKELFSQAALKHADQKSGSAYYYIPMTLTTLEAKMKPEDVVDLLDEIFVMQAKMSEKLRPSQRAKIETNNQNMSYMYIRNNYTQVDMNFPPVTGYFGIESIMATRGIYECWKNDPAKLKVLEESLAKKAALETEDPYLRIARAMAVASFSYWTDHKPEVLASFDKAVEVGMDPTVAQLTRVRLLYETGRQAEALDAVKKLRPTNQQMLVDRELAILQLALEMGNLDDARQSAQKLFALKLSNEVEFQLADLMTQLGMKDMGEKMMGRIRRRSGGSKDALAQLMSRYSQAGQNDAAAEVAMQVIRRTSPRANSNSRTVDNSYHENALRILKKAGRLDELITRTEKQLERSPKSTVIINSLSSYYEAAGRRSDADKVLGKFTETSKTVDPKVMQQSAQQLARAGKHEEAVAKYLTALEKDPNMLSNYYYEMQPSFQKVKQYDKMADMIVKVGIVKFQNSSYRLSEVLSELNQANQTEAADRLILAIVETSDWYTLGRSLESMSRNSRSPSAELNAAVRKLLLDEEGKMQTQSNSLSATTYYSNGRVKMAASSVLSLAEPDQELLKEVAAVMKKKLEQDESAVLPRYLLAGSYIRLGELQQAEEVVSYVVNLKNKDHQNFMFLWAIGADFIDRPNGVQPAIRTLEPMLKVSEEATGNSGLGFGNSHLALLADAYKKNGQKLEAKKLVLDALNGLKVNPQYASMSGGYGDYQYVNSYISILENLISTGATVEAAVYLQRLESDKAKLEAAISYSSYISTQLTEKKKSLQQKVTAPEIVSVLVEILKAPSADQPADSPEALLQTMLLKPTVDKPTMLSAQVNLPILGMVTALSGKPKVKEAFQQRAEELKNIDTNSLKLPQLFAWIVLQKNLSEDGKVKDVSLLIENWLKANPAPVELDFGKGSTRQEMENELIILALADLFSKEDQIPIDLLITLYDRSEKAAIALHERELVATLNCRLAEKYAGVDDQKAREILMSTLNTLIP